MKGRLTDGPAALETSRPTRARRLTVVVAVFVLLVPLGVLLPRVFGAGSAWGEWSVPELRKKLGFVPKGIEALGDLWSKAPLDRYAVFHGRGLLPTSAGYLLAGFIGILFVLAVSYLLARVLVSGDEEQKVSMADQKDEKDDAL